jgi:hypothetical protein
VNNFDQDVVDPSDGRGAHSTAVDRSGFDAEVAEHDRHERRLLWKEVAAIMFVAAFVVVRQLWQQ